MCFHSRQIKDGVFTGLQPAPENTLRREGNGASSSLSCVLKTHAHEFKIKLCILLVALANVCKNLTILPATYLQISALTLCLLNKPQHAILQHPYYLDLGGSSRCNIPISTTNDRHYQMGIRQVTHGTRLASSSICPW